MAVVVVREQLCGRVASFVVWSFGTNTKVKASAQGKHDVCPTQLLASIHFLK